MRTLYFYHELEDLFEDQLTDSYGVVDICGFTYESGHALRQMDEIAFRNGVLEWSNEEFVELSASDLTEEEADHYDISDSQTLYCRRDELEDN